MKRKKCILFTISDIQRYIREGRGQGIKELYIPWHKVKRGDPSSHGKSGRYYFRGREIHLLSTVERHAFLFATMHTSVYDIREQFPLSLEPSPHELLAYSDSYGSFYDGTLGIANKLGIKHQTLRDGSKQAWTMTTDLLITLKVANCLRLLAVACKANPPHPGSGKYKALSIEKQYWQERGVSWLLITPKTFDKGFADSLRSHYTYGMDQAFDADLQKELIAELSIRPNSYCGLISLLSKRGYSDEEIKKAFWTGYWFGDIPMDVHIRFQPLKLIKFLSKEAFLDLNPIYSGRSAWDHV